MSRRVDPGPLGTGKLTDLDQRVLAQLSRERGRRARTIAFWVFYRRGSWHTWKPSDRQVSDVRAVLRGFEHLGKVSGRGGWWRAL